MRKKCVHKHNDMCIWACVPSFIGVIFKSSFILSFLPIYFNIHLRQYNAALFLATYSVATRPAKKIWKTYRCFAKWWSVGKHKIYVYAKRLKCIHCRILVKFMLRQWDKNVVKRMLGEENSVCRVGLCVSLLLLPTYRLNIAAKLLDTQTKAQRCVYLATLLRTIYVYVKMCSHLPFFSICLGSFWTYIVILLLVLWSRIITLRAKKDAEIRIRWFLPF